MLHQTITFTAAAHLIAERYPLPFSQGTALHAAENALFGTLDPFSFRMAKNDYSQMREESSGKYGGIGITVAPRDTLLMVLSVRTDGPAFIGGMRSGDYIIRVDSVDVPHDDPRSVTDHIRGESGTTVAISVYRPSLSDILKLEIIRESIKLVHIPYAGLNDDGVAYIHVTDFEAGAAEDIYEQIEVLEKQNPVGYIIDLKNNPGGYLYEAIDAADVFMNDGDLIVGTDSRSKWEKRELFSSSDPLTAKPIVILTNQGSASAAEIFSGALRGVNRAVVVGDTTFGKGLVQSVFGLSNGDAIRLTTSRYYFADGRFLNPPDSALAFSGLAPDIIHMGNAEISFQRLLLSGFLLYDFIEEHREFLSSLPHEFAYPDSVVTLFGNFLKAQNVKYSSSTTDVIALAIMRQAVEEASDAVIKQLNKLRQHSEIIDSRAFVRQKEFLLYHIRRLVVEQNEGQTASYKHVIVPGRSDIRLASKILLNPDEYKNILEPSSELVSDIQ